MEKAMGGMRVVPEDGMESGPCACCGGVTRRVWGYLLREEVMLAAFFVEWTQGHVRKHGAFFDLIVGRWGDGTPLAEVVFGMVDAIWVGDERIAEVRGE